MSSYWWINIGFEDGLVLNIQQALIETNGDSDANVSSSFLSWYKVAPELGWAPKSEKHQRCSRHRCKSHETSSTKTFICIFFNSRLLHWHKGNCMIAPVPVLSPWNVRGKQLVANQNTATHNKPRSRCTLPEMYSTIFHMETDSTELFGL